MGDTIEFMTSPSHARMCFKVTSSGLNFDIKTSGYVGVGLSKKPGPMFDVVFTLDNNHIQWADGENRVNGGQANTQDILSPHQYNKFWLLWSGNVVIFGKAGQIQPLVTYPSKSPQCMYISFWSQNGDVHWKVELPPATLKQPPVKPITKGSLRWVSADRQLPDDALIGGFENENLYIIRAKHRGSLTPGKFVPSEGTGYIAWGGAANEKEDIEVLCGYDCEWVPTEKNRIPMGAVEAGYSEVRREVLYVGRALYAGHYIPGKVQPSHRVCYIPYDGREVATANFEVLTQKFKWPCVNKYNILPNVPHHIALRRDDAFHETDDDEEDLAVNWHN